MATKTSIIIALLTLSRMVLSLAEMSSTSQDQCLLDVAPQPTRYFYHKDRVLDIRLETSDRVTHQLSTAVFAIFVREVLGYANVTITGRRDAFNVSAVLSRMSDCGNESCHSGDMQDGFVPETMINLEVWVPLGYNLEQWAASGYLEECGLLGPGGRFGWFMPDWTANQMLLTDHWRSLQDPKIASIFDVDSREMTILSAFTKDSNTGRYYCNASYCDEGIFYPEYCKPVSATSDPPPCAVLLAEYPDYMSFLIEQIPFLKLLVKVVWVGPNADRVVRSFMEDANRNETGKSVMFFAWRPSTITEERSFVSVAFPQCETLHAPDNDMRCAYEFQRFEKVAWSHIRFGAKLVFESLQRVFFTQDEYIDLLRMYNKRETNESVKEIACKWMRNNRKIWSQWEPTDLTAKTKLFIGGIFPLSGSWYSAPGMVPAAYMAVNAVNRNKSILNDYVIELKVANGQCSADMVMKSFIDYIRFKHFNQMVGILGPACSDTVEPIAGVSKHFKTIVISYSAEGSSFSDRNKFPYFFRTIGDNHQYKYVFLRIMKHLGWKRVAALTEDGQKYAEYISLLQDLVEQHGITFVANRKFPRDVTPSMSQYLEDLKNKKAKIIIGEFYDDRARSVMCEAYHQNMTARHGYVWFLPTWFHSRWYDTDYYNQLNSHDHPIPCTTQQMIQAINGYFSLTHSNYASDDSITHEGVNVSSWRHQYENECRNLEVQTSEYASYIYDAVWTYALALDKLLKQNHSLAADFHSNKTTETLVGILNETDFTGVSGRVRFAGGSSRLSDIRLVQWINKSRHLIGIFPPVINESTNSTINKMQFNQSHIQWLTEDGQQPQDDADGPSVCVLDGLAQLLQVECEVAIVIANVLGFSVFAGFLVIFFFIFKQRYEKKVKQTEERMRALGLLSSGTLLTLDEWEIPRERIVINRKLGEGAFGTVYGGEAFFDDKGWVAVAVKTLKVGSTVEEKLDFLSEAEMMKRFNHKNIVRLLGVCTRNEPIYTVMEFILYGDLKTYLLARRHLVNEKSREDGDEISNRRLTSIALDIAKALSYLADLKYVHRDVACRNCLVNSNRVAKLADFGMARPMYENDYYRFHRKGMLPVRWMAPESLVDGLFTPMTDIWSYGVLLYEIITFGSFPFQGLSNNQVLEHVKNGLTIEIPAGVKPQLETLLKSCWHRTPSLRPQASEIVELLTNNTRLIQPYVSIPLSSIPIEGTNSLELQLPQVRKSTSCSAKSNPLSSKLPNFELSLTATSNNSEHMNDPLLNNYSTTHYATQYITLQHGAMESDYVGESLDGVLCSTPV